MVLGGVAVSYERGTPVGLKLTTLNAKRVAGGAGPARGGSVPLSSEYGTRKTVKAGLTVIQNFLSCSRFSQKRLTRALKQVGRDPQAVERFLERYHSVGSDQGLLIHYRVTSLITNRQPHMTTVGP